MGATAIGAGTFWLSISGLGVTWLVYVVIATWRLAGIEARSGDAMRQATATLREKFEAQMEADKAICARARHDQANLFERALHELRSNLRDTDARHAVLDREAIRKADLAAFEGRLTASLSAHETRMQTLLATSETRRISEIEALDRRIAETIGKLAARP